MNTLSSPQSFYTKLLRLFLALIAVAPVATFSGNILVNPSFEANSGHTLPVGWSFFLPTGATDPHDYWIESSPPAQSGTLEWKEWGALYNTTVNNVAGIYQDFSSAPGSVYQASGWLRTGNASSGDVLGPNCRMWIQVEFYNSANTMLALYKSGDFTAGSGIGTWMNYQVTNVCNLSQPISVNDPSFTTYAVSGTVSQMVAPVGTTKVRYRFCYLQNLNEGGSGYLDAAVLDQVSGPQPPIISNIFPLNMLYVNPADGVSFTVNSPTGFTINNSGIHLSLNGSDVSGNLAISGTSSNKTVSYHGLQSNLTYTASITVTDSFGFTASASTYFETTWVGIPPLVYLWEAEDFDFNSGHYFNQPALCASPGNANCYFGTVGVEGVDEHNVVPGTTKLYRPDDNMGTLVSGDYLRKDHYAAGAQDYRIDPFQNGEWLNYTRDWSNGTFWVVARVSTGEGLSGSLTLSLVNGDGSTTDLGVFNLPNGHGWSTYDNVYLKDTNGNFAAVTLNGHATLRVTSSGNLLPNYFMLVAGQIDLPALSDLYPTGTRPFEVTNGLSFSVRSIGATIPDSGIAVWLDGINVSSRLQLGGSGSTRTVGYPGLQQNAMHTAIITVTNSLGHGIAVTNKFDTFSQDNYMVELEDYDYDNGQYIDFWYPDAYQGLGATTNVDYHHSSFDQEQYHYRAIGIPSDLTKDFLRDMMLGYFDYDLTWFGAGDWVNYTRNYPAGDYYVYTRLSGLGNYTMYLDQVVSGVGTTSQSLKRLGKWSSVGRAYNLYDWSPLLDNSSASVPTVVHLSGVTTLRLTTDGNTNPNYLMFVPASGVPLSSHVSGGNVQISFATQAGAIYRVFVTSDLGGTWTLFTEILGDGTVKTVSDPIGTGKRFYKVVSP